MYTHSETQRHTETQTETDRMTHTGTYRDREAETQPNTNRHPQVTHLFGETCTQKFGYKYDKKTSFIWRQKIYLEMYL